MTEILAIKEGDEAAFVRVYERLHIKVFRFFLRRLHLHETAGELTQLSFIKLWQCRNTLSASFSIDTQLFTISGTVLIDHLRKKARENRHTSLDFHLADTDAYIAENSRMNDFELQDYLNAAMEQLPPVRKKVLVLKAVHAYSNKEVAHALSISVKTVEDHITKALRYIRSVSASFIPLLLLSYLLQSLC